MGQLRKDILRRHSLAAAGVLLFSILYYAGFGIEYQKLGTSLVIVVIELT